MRSCAKRSLRWLAGLSVWGTAALVSAEVAYLDLSAPNFFADSSVSIGADGRSALMREDALLNPVLISNDPSQGDPTIIVAETGVTLRFSYEFKEAVGEDDSFTMALLDLTNGQALSSVLQNSASGDVTLDLTPLVGRILGLEFELRRVSGAGLNSTALISDLRLVRPDAPVPDPIPEPGSVALLGVGLLALWGWTRAMRTRRVVHAP